MYKITVEAPHSVAVALRDEIAQSSDASTAVSGVEQKKQSVRGRDPVGMEPATYFVVVFFGHLAAGFTHDAIVNRVIPMFEKYKDRAKTSIETQYDDETSDKDDL